MASSSALERLRADRQRLYQSPLRSYQGVLESAGHSLDDLELNIITDEYLLEVTSITTDLNQCADRATWSDAQREAVQTIRATAVAIARVIHQTRNNPEQDRRPTFYRWIQQLGEQLLFLSELPQ